MSASVSSSPKTICVIPARYASSRFPGKPLVDIHGKPMIVRVYEQCAQATLLDAVYVATDDDRIAAACKDHDVPVVMTASTHPTGTDRVGEAVRLVSEREGEVGIIVNVQGDEPMLEPATIDAVVRPLLDDASIGVTNGMTRIRELTDIIDATVPKVVVNRESDAVYLSRSPVPYPKDPSATAYFKQVCVYGFRPAPLADFCADARKGPAEAAEDIELLRFIERGVKVRMVEVDQDTVAVDTSADLERVRRLLGSS